MAVFKFFTTKICKAIIIVILIIFVFFSINFLIFAVNRYLYPLKYKEIVFEYADLYGIDRPLVFATIRVESSFDEKAKSNKGAVGLMQITPTTAEFIANRLGEKQYDLFDEKTNIKFGTYYLRYLLDKFKVLETAICAYNAGEGRVKGWLLDTEKSTDGIILKYIPYKETKEYLEKIVKTFEKYKKLYGNILDKS